MRALSRPGAAIPRKGCAEYLALLRLVAGGGSGIRCGTGIRRRSRCVGIRRRSRGSAGVGRRRSWIVRVNRRDEAERKNGCCCKRQQDFLRCHVFLHGRCASPPWSKPTRETGRESEGITGAERSHFEAHASLAGEKCSACLWSNSRIDCYPTVAYFSCTKPVMMLRIFVVARDARTTEQREVEIVRWRLGLPCPRLPHR